MSSKIYEESGYGLDLDWLSHLILIDCFIPYVEWTTLNK